MERREQIARRSDLPGFERRALLTDQTDVWLRGLFDEATTSHDPREFCLLAIGGYGRGEMCLGSDIDVVLVHEPRTQHVEEVASAIWYPIWDSGIALDHAVRTSAQARALAREDFKVGLGLMDARPIAGNIELGQALRADVLADWRAGAQRRLSDLHEAVIERRRRVGDLAQLLEPDIKEAYGGLRDAAILRALRASWVVEVPHTPWQHAVNTLLDLRDALHLRSARDRLSMQEQDELASQFAQVVPGVHNADDLLRVVYLAGRQIAQASDIAWYRALRSTRMSSRLLPRVRTRITGRVGREFERTPLAEGVVEDDGEVVLARGADTDGDPGLALRAAAAAAQAGLIMAPVTIERLIATPRASNLWSRNMRESFISLLGAGPSAIPVFESLDQAGMVEQWIPEWSTVRSLPQRNAIHEFTVDRHLLQTAVHANERSRDVDRPDLLLVAAFLHDIGKGLPGDHSEVGAPIARAIATRMGFDEADASVIETLVRHHLLLPDVATRRDLDDASTIDSVTAQVRDVRTLELLHALTWADAEATGPSVRSSWRRQLIFELVARCRAQMRGEPLDPPTDSPQLRAALGETGETTIRLIPAEDGCSIVVSTTDRVGLLSKVAGVLSLHRLQIRGARVRSEGPRAAQEWFVRPLFGDAPDERAIAADVRATISGTLDVADRLHRRVRESSATVLGAAPKVLVDRTPATHTVIEVRAHDQPGLLYRITCALVAADTVVTGAKIDTLGSDVVDAFFLTDRLGAPLNEGHAEAVRTTVQAALEER